MNHTPWGPIRSALATHFSFGDIKQIIGYTNIDMSRLAHLEQKWKDGATKSQLLSAIDSQIGAMNSTQVEKVASICCEEMLIKKPQLIDEFQRILARVGWRFFDKNILPIEIFDIAELSDIPQAAHEDIKKAAIRLRDGDLSGALSSACGALDSVTSYIYQELSLGDPNMVSFQQRIKVSLNSIDLSKELYSELQSLGWVDSDITSLSKNLEGSLNQAAFVMQKLRSDMGDVHGTKPVISALVYDSIKWSLLLLRALNIRSKQ